ncbi:hypothetical protein P4U99_27230 [Brevibacillus agri]|uniref:GapS4a family protein n=1 Tax=Brevibacillus TaxID=55080 RepID=UPI00040849D3|nr:MULTISPECIES: hypothetical protein [Brevibacillus]MED1646807.1 hypothetical protein [Brevibacillus agri]MED1657865.1 hypothetical protein [Brevibacillus agri]MED1690147.1 hypothetical protein [Brevibacillus agri]MED1695324.1 hypothetical protein [Brevibacillus agri]MED1700792.1 hypothetical protein [Brevibacillus agri]
MSGEKAKHSGEYGERIAAELLKLIGWNNSLSGKNIPCVHNEIHYGENGNPRQIHGVDFIVKYECPLVSRLESNVIISVKHRDGYPKTSKGITTKFKSFLKDIAEATECYPAHELYRQRIKGTKKIEISNVIMWFDSAIGQENKGVISELQSFRNSDNVNYKTVYLVDNKKANFLYSSIKYVQSKNDNFFFYYPDTGFNMDTTDRTHQGRTLPVQYINSPVQLFKIIEPTGRCLIIVSEDNFSIDYFERLLQLARLITVNWASKIVIAFPDYNNYKNEDEIKVSISKVRDGDFAQAVIVEKYGLLDFRNIGGIFNEERG